MSVSAAEQPGSERVCRSRREGLRVPKSRSYHLELLVEQARHTLLNSPGVWGLERPEDRPWMLPEGWTAQGQGADSHFCLPQVAQRKGVKGLSSLDPEVLSVFVPPFVMKEDSQPAAVNCMTLAKNRKRSFRKKRERPRVELGKGVPGGPRGPDPEDVNIPNGVDLLALPQLCFPGMHGLAFSSTSQCLLMSGLLFWLHFLPGCRELGSEDLTEGPVWRLRQEIDGVSWSSGLKPAEAGTPLPRWAWDLVSAPGVA